MAGYYIQAALIDGKLSGFGECYQQMPFMRKIACLLIVSSQFLCTVSAGTYNVYPPFLNDKKVLVSQGFNGQQTHTGNLNRFAVDLVMSEGDLVCSVDEGTVMSVNSTRQHSDFNESNYVRIKHKNGLISDYQHLLAGSITVKVGQLLALGECFAQAGSSGHATGPHLHFAILEMRNHKLVSMPFKFISPDDKAYTPEHLQWVYN